MINLYTVKQNTSAMILLNAVSQPRATIQRGGATPIMLPQYNRQDQRHVDSSWHTIVA